MSSCSDDASCITCGDIALPLTVTGVIVLFGDHSSTLGSASAVIVGGGGITIVKGAVAEPIV
mgnify:CR=1 FL=1